MVSLLLTLDFYELPEITLYYYEENIFKNFLSNYNSLKFLKEIIFFTTYNLGFQKDKKKKIT